MIFGVAKVSHNIGGDNLTYVLMRLEFASEGGKFSDWLNKWKFEVKEGENIHIKKYPLHDPVANHLKLLYVTREEGKWVAYWRYNSYMDLVVCVQ